MRGLTEVLGESPKDRIVEASPGGKLETWRAGKKVIMLALNYM
jgi:hypothetical protein